MPTTPTTHAVHPCALSLLSLPIPHLPHSHTNGTPHATHTWRGLCGSTHAPQPVSTRLGALPWPSQPLVSFLCVLWCAPQLTLSFSTHTHTQREKWFVVSCCSKVSPEREDEHTHSPTCFSFLFSHNPFQWRIWRHPLSLTSTFHSLVHSLSWLCASK